ncbi:MAG: hypothetical protein V3V00_15920 [Saprospiraceae bacterium]
MTTLKLYHTSPHEITEIHKDGFFDDCLFFSSEVYDMGDCKFVYSIEIDSDAIDDVCRLYDTVIIDDIAMALDVSCETAAAYLCGEETALDPEDDLYMQARQGECAKKDGYLGCKGEDEQGAVYIIPMFGKELILKLERQ